VIEFMIKPRRIARLGVFRGDLAELVGVKVEAIVDQPQG
jgi:hypothetical protein